MREGPRLLSWIRRSLHFRTLLIAGSAIGLLAISTAWLLGAGQACRAPDDVSKVAGVFAAPGTERSEERPFLGITYTPITPHMATDYGLSTDAGALVTAVTRGSPAEQAGIQVDDIIVELDGQKVDNEVTIVAIMNEHLAGNRLAVGIVRKGEQRNLEIVLGSRP